MKDPTLTEIANRIHAHLKRFEADPKLNPLDPTYQTRPFFYAHAWRTGRQVGIKYVSYQHASGLSKQQALAYLAWLDAGNVGTHFKMESKTGTR